MRSPLAALFPSDAAMTNGDAIELAIALPRLAPPPLPPSLHCLAATRSSSGSSARLFTKWMHCTGQAATASSTASLPSAHWSTTLAHPNRVSIQNVVGAMSAHLRHPMQALSSTNAASCLPRSSSGSPSLGPDHADSGEGSISDWSLEPRPLASHSLRSRSKRARSVGDVSTEAASLTSAAAADAYSPARSGWTAFCKMRYAVFTSPSVALGLSARTS